MPSAQDIYDSIKASETKLEEVKGKLDTVIINLTTVANKLDAVNASVQAVDASVKKMQQLLLWGFQQLITLGQYTNKSLFHNNKQNDAMICLLQQISDNTCGIWNETHTQTDLQQGMKVGIQKLVDLFAATHGDAAITLEREASLRRQIEVCCPPKQPVPVCVARPCREPERFDERPPETERPPREG
jgi:hypothetical protein